ncbi:MAG: DUF2892 domain-containing protein [Halioglobus sp.]
MIEKNLGNVERVARLIFGLCFGIWAISQPHLNGIEWTVMAVSICLILNGIFSRCYLWYVIERKGNYASDRPSHTGIC